MIQFSDLEFQDMGEEYNGIQASVRFDNGYGASVIKSQYSQGGTDGLYELIVLCLNCNMNDEGSLAGQVTGNLTEDDVVQKLIQIEGLLN
jgi:hypothetical protein